MILYFYHFLKLRYFGWISNFQFFSLQLGYQCSQIFFVCLLIGYQQVRILKIQKFACQLCWVSISLILGKKNSKGNILLLKGNCFFKE